MTIKELADKLRKFNVEADDINWLLRQTTVETAILTACEFRLGVVMKLVSPASWADYERIRDVAWADYERITKPAWADYQRTWGNYEGIKDAARMELLTILEKV